MIVADTSAIIAILQEEPECHVFERAMMSDGEVLVSTATAVETLMVATGKGEETYRSAVQYLDRPFIRLVPLDEQQLWAAANAFRRYGKGRHPAGLNFGDTFSYALASTHQVPLLFKGNDFNLTDIPTASS